MLCTYEGCGRDLYDEEFCIFHSKDEGKVEAFMEAFWDEYKRKGGRRKFFQDVFFPSGFSFRAASVRVESSAKGRSRVAPCFYRANFSGAILNGVDCMMLDLRLAMLNGAQLQGTNLTEANLSGAELTGANLQGAQLSRANLKEAQLIQANFNEAQFQGANLTKAQLLGSSFTEANFLAANLKGACFNKANLLGARFHKTNLQGVQFIDAYLKKAQFQEASIEDSEFSEANLQGAQLNKANLERASLYSATLMEADLSEANAQGANFDEASLLGANLRGANFTHTSLRNTLLVGAIFNGDEFNEAEYLTGIVINKADIHKMPANLREKFMHTWNIIRDDPTPKIIRDIEFPPEYHQAGVSILTYFGTVLRQRYPDKKAKVNISQKDLTVTMTIETNHGDKETIEKALDDYGLVAVGQMKPEEFIKNPYHAMNLQHKLDMAQLELKNSLRIIQMQDRQLESLTDDTKALTESTKELRKLLSKAFSQNNKVLNFAESHTRSVKDLAGTALASKQDLIDYLQKMTAESAGIKNELSTISQKLGNDKPAVQDIAEVESALQAIHKKTPGKFAEIRDTLLQFGVGVSGSLWASVLIEIINRLNH